jgi:hypothetical protein
MTGLPLTRAHVGALLVALMMLTAGCNFAGPGTTAPSTTEPTSAEPTTEPTTTSTSTTTTTTGSGQAFPDGFSREGITGGPRQVITQQYQTLNGTSYTVDYLANIQGNSEEGSYQVNHAERRASVRQVPSGSPIIEAYTADGGETTFQRTLDPANTTYQRGSTSFALFHSRSRPASVVLPTYRGLNWTYEGTVTENGVERLVYTVAGIDTSRQGSIDPSRVSNLSGRLEVTPEGRILLLSWGATVDDGSEVTYRYELSAVGSTTIEEPGWLSEAREQTSTTTTTASG